MCSVDLCELVWHIYGGFHRMFGTTNLWYWMIKLYRVDFTYLLTTVEQGQRHWYMSFNMCLPLKSIIYVHTLLYTTEHTPNIHWIHCFFVFKFANIFYCEFSVWHVLYNDVCIYNNNTLRGIPYWSSSVSGVHTLWIFLMCLNPPYYMVETIHIPYTLSYKTSRRLYLSVRALLNDLFSICTPFTFLCCKLLDNCFWWCFCLFLFVF